MDIGLVLGKKYPGNSWVIRGGTYDGLEWDKTNADHKPSETELIALWPTVQAEIAAEEQAKIDAKASAIAKLEALGLTVEEIKTAFGLE